MCGPGVLEKIIKEWTKKERMVDKLKKGTNIQEEIQRERERASERE